MSLLKQACLASVIVLAAGSAVPAARNDSSSALGNILQSELQRNFDRLSKEPVPPYFLSYTVHDVRGHRVVASFGALQRSDQGRSRFGTVEVRAGDYTLDSTHPLRGGNNALANSLGSQQSRVSLSHRRCGSTDPLGILAGHRSCLQAGYRIPHAREGQHLFHGEGRKSGT